jgi:hypothetical protein
MAGNIQTEGDSLIIHPDKRKMIRRLNMRGFPWSSACLCCSAFCAG